ncbi:MAG: type III-A CRISPR-associated protein Csm2 [Bacteroidetes bacterium]|nr:type III-A CRISPR-associated protein Csm2 [Bacteroidota bacterium]
MQYQQRPQNSPGPRPQQGGGRPERQTAEDKLSEVKKQFGENFYQLILSPKSPETYNEYIEKVKGFVEKNSNEMTTSQIRNIFSTLKRPDLTVLDVHKLRPKIAYAYGRAEKEGFKNLLLLLDDQFRQVKTDNQKTELVEFLESIIAFHRFFGRK